MKKLRIFKALSKHEGPNVCWDARFLIFFLNFNQLPAAKKGFKKQASLQRLGSSYFVRTLAGFSTSMQFQNIPNPWNSMTKQSQKKAPKVNCNTEVPLMC